ncbi:Glutaredoxin family protein [Babesia bovis T2Bo]|uniref:Glutaredoxin family protein n=1 Tax=Babesia bovis T2Bo TaxID=484906 RepID=UPI001D2C7A7B|nr:Glutaredoxin family protein [Babesia bovis T2Bo]EDO07426.2 Glutaredoxin family protein [Babesia bovis T2Bo]
MFSGITLPFVLSHYFGSSWIYTTSKIASWKLATCEASCGNTTPIKPTCCKQNCCASCVTEQSKESCSDDTKDSALPELKPETEQKIKEEITKYNVVLFIKGTANKPACKYSRQAIDILKESRAPIIRTVNVLDDPDLSSTLEVNLLVG